MIKNRKTILSSMAIIFTLIMCAIFVNLTLANSRTSVDETEAELSASTSTLLGYTNIDLAVINSNDTTLTNNEDKFKIVQILPDNCSDLAAADTEATAYVEAGTTVPSALLATTTSLWKYVYDGEYFRLAVFNGYKTISDSMAAGAVTLQTFTVSQLNDMDDTAQTALGNADFIYIYAASYTDYINSDISQEVYDFLVSYTTADGHPLVISQDCMCIKDTSTIVGNNDDYLMGTFAYKIMTKSYSSRYNNVLVVNGDYFYNLYVEAAGSDTNITEMGSAEYTIASYIWTAITSTGSGGSYYIKGHTFYLWYASESLETFASGNSSYEDSAYGVRTASAGTTWDFDNAKILVIRDGDEGSSTMYNALKSINSSSSDLTSTYKDNSNGTWVASTSAKNSDLTSLLYYTANNYAYVPSGADIYVVNSEDLQIGITKTGTTYADMSLSSSYFQDVNYQTISGTITIDGTLSDEEEGTITVYLLITDTDGTHLVYDENGDPVTTTLSTSDFEDGVGTYTFANKLNADFAYSICAVCEMSEITADDITGDGDENGEGDDTGEGDDAGTGEENDGGEGDTGAETAATEISIGYSGYNIIITPSGSTQDSSYDYDEVLYDEATSTNNDYIIVDTAAQAAAYVKYLWTTYSTTQLSYKSTATTIDLSSFDYIFIEAGNYYDEIGVDVYSTLKQIVADDAVWVIASSGCRAEAVSSDGSSTSGTSGEYITSPSAKDIADLINAATYRDGSDNKFRVLEIQPAYPIDEELARSSESTGSVYNGDTNFYGVTISGDYYTTPSDVISGYAKEELEVDIEYYDFDLTKAKIAYALQDYDISYSDIELTQTSMEGLIGMTDDIAATYDLIYIGGDISAVNVSVDTMYASSIWSYVAYETDLANSLPIFLMYAHTGRLVQMGTSYSGDREKSASVILATPLIDGVLYGTSTGYTYNGTTYTAAGGTTVVMENGNDLTQTKYDELYSYVMGLGMPIIISDELTTVYENMNATDSDGNALLTDVQRSRGYWYNNGILERGNYYLDPSSRVYDLIEVLYTNQSKSNILWGFDASDDTTQMIVNSDKLYGDTLYTYDGSSNTSYLDTVASTQSWYSSETTIKNYAVVYADSDDDTDNNYAIYSLVKNSNKRTRLTVISSPTTYQENIESTYLKNVAMLTYKFSLSAASGTYSYRIVVDKNKNCVFDSASDGDYETTGNIDASGEVTDYIDVEEDYFGSAYWLIEISDSDGNVVAQKTGLCKIVNDDSEGGEVRVLQIQCNAEQGTTASWKVSDTLYFDTMSQWAHKILIYNGWANSTDTTNACVYGYECLGLHETIFGIVSYDTSISNDDWLTNLAEVLWDDYDITIDLVVADKDYDDYPYYDSNGEYKTAEYDCIETWVAEAETLKAGGTVDSMTQEDYVNAVDTALTAYEKAIVNTETYKAAIDSYLYGFIEYLETGYEDGQHYGKIYSDTGATGLCYGLKLGDGVTAEEYIELCEYMIKNSAYYMIWFPKYYNNSPGISSENSIKTSFTGTEWYNLFANYRDAKNAEIIAKNTYYTYLRRSYGADFLKEMYTILVLGPSEGFGGYYVDMDTTTVSYILDFVENGGDLFFFHDSMTVYQDAGAVNLTTAMLDIVGMNRFHVDFTDQSNTYSLTTNAYLSSASSSGGYLMQGTLEEDGFIYDYAYNHSNDSSWETIDEAMTIVNQWGSWIENAGIMARKWVYAGTSGYYIFVEEEAAYSTSETVSTLTYKSTSLYYTTNYTSWDSLYGNLTNSIVAAISATGIETNKPGSGTTYYISALAMTSLYYDKQFGGTSYNSKYLYARQIMSNALSWSGSASADQSGTSETVKASQLNEGLITMYPFSIGDTLNISGTHQQAYALDMESTNVTVWYTLAGSNNSNDAKNRSALYAADPYDAMENYFIYTTALGDGAITYSGSGHSSVTGPTTRNNDERKLYINVIVNSAAAVKDKPSIKVYDPDADKLTEELAVDSEIKAATGKTVYVIETESADDEIAFDIGITIPSGVTVSTIKVYYDLDLDVDNIGSVSPSCGEGDVVIYENSIKGLTSDAIKELAGVFTYTTDNTGKSVLGISMTEAKMANLSLKEEYFSKYGGQYTFIVVAVTYDSGKTVYAIIKIKTVVKLFELTQADTTYDNEVLDAIEAKKYVIS